MKKVKIGLGALAILAIVCLAVVFMWGNLDTGPKLSVYSGRLKVNLVQVKRIDGSAYRIADAQMRIIHGDMDYNSKVGDLSSATVTGEMTQADSGTWFLIIDYGTNNTCWLDHSETVKDPYVQRVFGSDGDRDGFNEEYVELYFGDLSPLKAGEDKKEVEVKLVSAPARTSSITYTSLTNASSIGTTSYSYYTSTGYMAGFTEGDLGKIAKVELVFDETGNNTYPDSGYWMLTHLKIGPYTWGTATFGTYDLANTRYKVEFGDQINSQGGKDVYYAKNAGDLWASYELKAYCNYPSASKVIVAKVKFYFYKPDGTLTSAFTAPTQFAS